MLYSVTILYLSSLTAKGGGVGNAPPFRWEQPRMSESPVFYIPCTMARLLGASGALSGRVQLRRGGRRSSLVAAHSRVTLSPRTTSTSDAGRLMNRPPPAKVPSPAAHAHTHTHTHSLHSLRQRLKGKVPEEISTFWLLEKLLFKYTKLERLKKHYCNRLHNGQRINTKWNALHSS